MSLDDTYQALHSFSRTLEDFDSTLRADRNELAKLHGDIDGLWRDSFRNKFDLAMEDLQREFDTYTQSQSEQFEVFIRAKVAQLGQYLHGG